MDSSGGFSIKARRAFTTKNGFLKMIQTKETENMKKNEANGQGTWSNIDLDPTPPGQRNWSAWYFFAFQFSISFSPTTYNVGASLIAVGLSWWIILVASGKLWKDTP
jgi:NCS1 family nucleobase:cation symporter-1